MNMSAHRFNFAEIAAPPLDIMAFKNSRPIKPWLTVVMPVHHGEQFLPATLASAAAQPTDGVEFLIYNSGDDGGASRRIAEGFADHLDIKWRETPELPSWTAKTNLGVREARAEHVAMLHQDDLWLPGHLVAIRRAIASNPDAVLSVAPSRFADPNGHMMGHWHLPFRPGLVATDDFFSTLLVQSSIAIPSPVVRRDAWLAVGGMDEDLWFTADWDIYLKLATEGRVAIRSETTTAFRLHRGSLTMTGSRRPGSLRPQLEQVLDRHLRYAPGDSRRRIERRARASIEVNCALADASCGDKRGLANAAMRLLCLGPVEVARYVRQSRIIDRLVPRLRLALAGDL
jgi:glycosyltransferase involved in cell wall biosynthesis